MNTSVISGRLTRNAVLNGGENKALQFTIAAKYGYNTDKGEDLIEYVPCVLFNPSEALASSLMNEGKGLFIEFEGRVATSKYEKDGRTVYNTNVVVNPRGLNFVSSPANAN